MSKESSPFAWFNQRSRGQKAVALAGVALTAAALAGCASQKSDGGTSTATAAASQAKAPTPDCSMINVEHDKGSYEVTLSVDALMNDPGEYGPGQIVYDFGNNHGTTRGGDTSNGKFTYTYPEAGTYTISGDITIEPAPGVTNIAPGPNVKNDPNAYPCPDVKVTIP